MIAILLRDLRWRLLVLALLFLGLLWWELEARSHGTLDPVETGPASISAPMAYLASLAMILLLAGFVSTDRREGYTRIFFSHPTAPLAFYALRWGLALGIALASAFTLLVAVQVIAWEELRGGWSGLLLPLLTALIFGGLMAFLSAALPRGDAWVAFALFLPTLFGPYVTFLLDLVSPGVRRAVLFLLPPQTTALQDVYQGLLLGEMAWGAAAYAAGYGIVWLALAVVLLRLREWP